MPGICEYVLFWINFTVNQKQNDLVDILYAKKKIGQENSVAFKLVLINTTEWENLNILTSQKLIDLNDFVTHCLKMHNAYI